MKEQEKFRIASGTPEAGKIEVPTIHYEEILQITGIDNFDFIKIDAEGMDKEIVFQILNISEARNIFPGCIYFEEHSVDKPLIARLFQLNYITFPTGITKSGKFIDRCAIRRNFLRNSIFPPKFILDSHH